MCRTYYGPRAQKKNKTEFRFRVAPLQIFLSDMAGSYFGVPIERVRSHVRLTLSLFRHVG